MSNAIARLDPSKFNYTKFELDLRKKITKENLTLKDVSTKILYRSNSYLVQIFKKQNLPVNIFFALCDRFGFSAKDYEIRPEPPKPAPAPAPVEKKEPEKGWRAEAAVDTTAGVVAFTIFKNGEEKVKSRALIFDFTDKGIVKAVSYAAHMAYKFAEQKEIDAKAQAKPKEKAIAYKDWIAQFERAKSVNGSLARYIKNYYNQFPRSGRKSMRAFLLQNRGSEYLSVFDMTFQQYIDTGKALEED